MVLQANTDPELTAQLAQTAKSRVFWKALRRIPLATWVAAQHAVGWSEQSAHVDLRTRLIVGVGQGFFDSETEPVSIAELQALTLRPRGVPRNTWISRYASPPPPETGAIDALVGAVAAMAHLDADAVPRPEYVPVEAEWTAYRPDRTPAQTSRPKPADLSDRDRYRAMMRDVGNENKTTILYFHGGAFVLLDPESHRPYVKQLCQRTGGRAYSVRYRLSPQAVFPAALLDAFVSYLTLLYPPPDAYHEPVKAEHIVISGDSAGGNLSLALLQLLLQLRRTNVRVAWHGTERSVPLPAGAACNSPWLDMTHSFVGLGADDKADKYDVLTRMKPDRDSSSGGGFLAHRRPDHLWPTRPPRRALYVDDHLTAHPLASVVATRAEDWRGCPPVFLCVGWEHLGTEVRVLARRLASDAAAGVPVVLAEYEAMPHCFALVAPSASPAEHCWRAWAGFIGGCVSGPAAVRSRATVVAAKTLVERPLEFSGLLDFDDDEARRIFEEKQSSSFKPAARL